MSLRRAAASGMKWSSASMVLVTLLQLSKYLILARILPPADFGLVAMVLVIINYGFAFSDVGVNKALVHYRDTTQQQRVTLYWLNVMVGILLTLILILVAPLVSLFFEDPRIVDLLRVSAFAFIVIALGQQFEVLLQKELEFRIIAIVNVVANFIGTVVAVVTAFLGYGPWSLLWGYLVNIIGRSIGLGTIGMRRWPLALMFKLGGVRKYLSFGMFELGTRIVNVFNNTADQLLIGIFLGPQALGYYSMAFYIVVMPLSRINSVFNDVMFPILAKIQNEIERLRRGYYRMLKLLMIINVPLMIGLLLVAPVFVPTVLGAKWQPTVFILQMLAIVSLLRSAINPTGALLLAKGRADLSFRWNLCISIVQISGIALGTIWGIVGVSAVLLVLQVGYSTVGYFALIRPILGSSFNKYLSSIMQPSGIAMIMAAPVLSLPLIMANSGIYLLAGQVLLGAIVYIGITILFQRDEVHELGQLLLNR